MSRQRQSQAHKTALFIGRFQPFHKGHYFSVKKLLSRYEKVVIGIGSSDKSRTVENPFSFSERKKMISACFCKAELERIRILPIPDIHEDSRWVSHVISCVPEFSDIYSNNNWVRRLFREREIKVRMTPWHDRKNCMAKRIRENMEKGKKGWERYVPKNTIKKIHSILHRRCPTLYSRPHLQ